MGGWGGQPIEVRFKVNVIAGCRWGEAWAVQHRRMSRKWPFEFPEEWLDRSIASLRAQHGITVLTDEERETGDLLQWSGHY